jgi:hypothetical protein
MNSFSTTSPAPTQKRAVDWAGASPASSDIGAVADSPAGFLGPASPATYFAPGDRFAHDTGAGLPLGKHPFGQSAAAIHAASRGTGMQGAASPLSSAVALSPGRFPVGPA